MVTIIRWFMLQSKKIKMELMIFNLIDQLMQTDEIQNLIDKYKKDIVKEVAKEKIAE